MDWSIVGLGLGLISVLAAFKKTPLSRWLKSESPDRLYFGPPIIERVSGAVGALTCLVPMIGYLRPAAHFSPWVMWLVVVPLIVLISCLCIFMAGPREVYINLVHRTCQKGSLWMFFLHKPPCRLTDESAIYVYAGRDSGPVFLWIAGMKDPKFLLAQAKSRDEAVAFAQKVGSLAHLPVRETTLAEMQSQASARKRS